MGPTYITIQSAAAMLHVTPAVLRDWDRLNILKPDPDAPRNKPYDSGALMRFMIDTDGAFIEDDVPVRQASTMVPRHKPASVSDDASKAVIVKTPPPIHADWSPADHQLLGAVLKTFEAAKQVVKGAGVACKSPMNKTTKKNLSEVLAMEEDAARDDEVLRKFALQLIHFHYYLWELAVKVKLHGRNTKSPSLEFKVSDQDDFGPHKFITKLTLQLQSDKLTAIDLADLVQAPRPSTDDDPLYYNYE